MPSKGEYNDQPSQTVPDMSLTIPELLQNHARGITTGLHQNTGEYFDTPIPRFDDITDEIAYKEQLAERVKEVEAKIKAYNERKKELEALEAKKQKDAAEAAQEPPQAKE